MLESLHCATLRQLLIKRWHHQAARLLHQLSAVKTRVEKPRRDGPAAACTDDPEAAAGGAHQGGAGVSSLSAFQLRLQACKRKARLPGIYLKSEQQEQRCRLSQIGARCNCAP